MGRIIEFKGIYKYIGLRFKRPKEEVVYMFLVGKRAKIVDIDTFFCLEPIKIRSYDRHLRLVEEVIVMPNSFYTPPRPILIFTEEKA